VTFVIDARGWRGGIGRFARETLPYLPAHDELTSPLRPTHPLAPFDLAARLRRARGPFFSHGYLPPARSKVPAIVTVHDLMYLRGHTAQSRGRAAYMQAMRPLYRRCAAVVTMSDAARDQVAEWLDGRVRVEAVGGGVGPAFAPAPVGARRGEPPVVLYVGSRAANKNIAGVLGGFAALRSRRDDAELWVTGDRAAWTPELAAAGVTGAADAMRFLGDVGEAELPAVYRQASVLLMPSTEEGYGLPALEAMATAVPVVYGGDAAMREIVADAGLSVDPHDHAAIGEALAKVLDDELLATSLGATGRRRAAARTWPDVAARISALVAELS
jgi:glycosyltransferase involved in cell wall biosynthesis